MSSKSIKNGLSAIANEVLEDVGTEAEKIVQRAESNAKEALKVAKEKALQTCNTIIDESITKTQSEKLRIENLTQVEERNLLLQTKESLVDKAFEKSIARLQDFANSDVYHEHLLRFIEEAALEINQKNLVVHVNVSDKKWLTQERLSQLSEKLQVNLKIAEEPENYLGGCKVQTSEGVITYDNTLENRLEQLKPLLRLKAARIMFEEEKENAG